MQAMQWFRRISTQDGRPIVPAMRLAQLRLMNEHCVVLKNSGALDAAISKQRDVYLARGEVRRAGGEDSRRVLTHPRSRTLVRLLVRPCAFLPLLPTPLGREGA